MPIEECPICNGQVSEITSGGNALIFCRRCGKFGMTLGALNSAKVLHPTSKAKLSGWTKEHEGFIFKSDDVSWVAQLKSPSVGEKATRLLLLLEKTDPKPGAHFSLDFFLSQKHFKPSYRDKLNIIAKSNLLPVTWSEDEDDLSYLVFEYLRTEKQFLEQTEDDYFRITPKGWAHLDSISRKNTDSTIGFIAMWFNKSVDAAHIAIESGIQLAGFEPLRIDRKEHNNKIDDEIIAGIRRSKFLVADFTGHRGGVYFEAGLATGLGLPVIWLCRQDELEKTHFDTRQYNFIVWEDDNLGDLSKALKNRIEATIGIGPLASNIPA